MVDTRFSFKTNELLHVLDILANKVKAITRLRELLTTKLPHGTFPMKVAIPIVPTIRVLVTLTNLKSFIQLKNLQPHSQVQHISRMPSPRNQRDPHHGFHG